MADDHTLQYLLLRLAERGERPAVVAYADDVKASVSFAELGAQAARLAGGLLADGLARGEPVVVAAPNSPGWIVAALGIVLAGGAVAPVNAALGRETLRHILSIAEGRRLFTVRAHLATLREAGAGGTIFLLDASAGDAIDGAVSWQRLLRDGPPSFPGLAESDDAALFFTSGTTGPPKGVPLTHANLRANLDALLTAGLVGADERVLLPLPLFHIYPFMVGMLLPLCGGAGIVLPSGMAGPAVVHALRDASVTAVVGVPKLLDALLKGIRQRIAAKGRAAAWLFDRLLRASIWCRRHGLPLGRALFAPLRRAFAPHLRLMASGGARLDPETAWALEALGWEVLTGYGLTETSPIVSFSRRGRSQMASAGQPLDNVEVRLENPDSAGFGEIWVRGPNVFRGYRNLPEDTREILTDDGWLRTRDLGRIDSRGCLEIAARADDTIVLADGKKVFPEDVESVLEQSPLIHKAALVAPDGRLAAIVVPKEGALRRGEGEDAVTALRAEVARVVRALPEYQRPGEVLVTRRDLAQTMLGKLQRHLLPPLAELRRQQPDVARGRGEPSPADQDLLSAELARRLWDWLQRRFPDRTVTMDSDPRVDLGIDSLDRVTMSLDLERDLGIRLREDAFAAAETVRALLEEAVAAEQGRATATRELRGALTEEQKRWLAPRPAPVWWFGILLYAVAKIVMRIAFRLEIRGTARLPPGPLVVTPNHVSYLDPVAVAAALPFRRLRGTYWGGFRELLFATAFRRLFSRATGILPIDPAQAPGSSLALAEAALERGSTLVWFPEGARSVDGRLQPFMPGIGRLLAESEATVLPVLIEGTFEAWPAARRRPRPHRVRIRFGEPISAAALRKAAGAETDPSAIARALRDRIAATTRETVPSGGAASDAAPHRSPGAATPDRLQDRR